ncbi:hypothetical protein CP532_2923 [Ophiocordyceps camponoti-leonardi (nom. inval.)]|nr:hypothetical protein CP532_2923 [Ophiocordyceps camponoti-leonardi (nom. inval.)]
MKLYIAVLGILASTTSAVTPIRRLHFPRNNGTKYGGDLSYAPPANGKPALVTGSPGYDRTSSVEDDETVTATMTSVLHKTRTSYVHSSATPSTVDAAVKATIPETDEKKKKDENDDNDSSSSSNSPAAAASSSQSLSTTTVTSKTLTTVTISRGAGAASNSASPEKEQEQEQGQGQEGKKQDQCTASTVTVTQPPVTKTVFVTATPEANERVPVFDKYRAPSFHKDPSGAATTTPPSSEEGVPATTVQSVVTVMPFPTGRNGTYVPGAARPSTFARLYRRS